MNNKLAMWSGYIFTEKHLMFLCLSLYRLYFQGGQGEPGTKGERGDPGLPVCMSHNIHNRIL